MHVFSTDRWSHMGALHDGTRGRTAGFCFCFCFYFCFWNLDPFLPLSSLPESWTETPLCSAFLDHQKSVCSVSHSSSSGWGHRVCVCVCLPPTQRHTHIHTCACKHTHALLHTCTSIYQTHSCTINTHSDTHIHTHTHTHTHILIHLDNTHAHTLVPPNLLLRCSKLALVEDLIPIHNIQITTQTHPHIRSLIH